MDVTKQRIAIAEFCGWKKTGSAIAGRDWLNPMDGDFYDDPPNYLEDLNAMNIAEGCFVGSKHFLWPDYVKNLQHVWIGSPIHAPAQFRAEALLKTIGKWES